MKLIYIVGTMYKQPTNKPTHQIVPSLTITICC